MSEDSPHKSGIKTNQAQAMLYAQSSEDSPHKSGIKTILAELCQMQEYVGRLAPQIGD